MRFCCKYARTNASMRAYMRAFIPADMHARVQLLTRWREARGAKRNNAFCSSCFACRVLRLLLRAFSYSLCN